MSVFNFFFLSLVLTSFDECGVTLPGKHELVIAKISQRQRHDEKDRVIEFLTGLIGDRLRAVHLAFAFDALGRHLECPGEKQGKRQAGGQQHQHGFHCPVRCAKTLEYQLQYLCNQPGDDYVGDTYLEDVTAF